MIIEIVLICIIVVCGFLYYRQDVIIKSQIEYIDDLENKHMDKYNKITEAYEKMKDIDDKGGFASDDEVGQVFKSLNDTIGELEKEIVGDR